MGSTATMGRVTKARLADELELMRQHCDALACKVDALDQERVALRQQVEVLKAERLADRLVVRDPAHGCGHKVAHMCAANTKLVHEFDPNVPGDFTRAMRAAREQGGTVRRAGAH